MQKWILFALVVLLIGVPTIGYAQDGTPAFPYLIINAQSVNLRSGPGAEFTSLGVMHGGEAYHITGMTNDRIWFFIENTPFGDGWVRGRYIIFRGDITAVPVISDYEGDLQTSTFVVAINIPVYDDIRGQEIGLLSPAEYPVIARSPLGGWVRLDTATYGSVWTQYSRGYFRGLWDLLPVIDQGGANDVVVELAEPYLIINTNALNIRTGPDVKYQALGSLRGGTSYNIDGKSPDGIWFHIIGTPYGGGWVRGRYIIFRGDLGAIPTIYEPYGELQASYLYAHIFIPVYTHPNGTQLGLVPGQTEYLITGRSYDGRWLLIRTSQFGEVWTQYSRGSFRGYWYNIPVILNPVPSTATPAAPSTGSSGPTWIPWS